MRLRLDTLSAWLADLRVPAPDKFAQTIKEDARYCEALAWARKFVPDSAKLYDWAYDYAADRFYRLDAAADYLDAKAEALMRYIATAAAILISALAAVGVRDWLLALLLVPSVICALLAAHMSASARSPQVRFYPPPAKQALKYAHACATQEEAKARFAAQFHAAAVGLLIAMHHKAKILRRATSLVLCAMWLMLLPVACVFVRWLVDP